MANPTLTPFPTPPLPEQDEVTFNRNAANSLLAQANFVGEANTVVTWMGQQVTDVASYKKAAADSATAAGQAFTDAQTQAGNAKTYADNAATYRDSAQAAAAAAQSSAGLPAIAGKAGSALTVNPDEKGVSWQSVGVAGFQEFTSSGTFAKPAGARYFLVELVSGGSSGAVYAGNGQYWVEGGIGGDFNTKVFRAADLPASVSVLLGEGGAAVTGTNAWGQPGADTTFGSLLKAVGAVAAQVQGTNSTLVSARDGEMRGGRRGGSIKGGGSGISLTNLSGNIGTLAPAGTSLDAGSGGAQGAAGAYPGGGGGANTANQSGSLTSGAGGKGRCRIWWW